MSRKLIIDGNAIYEIDEDCMVRKEPDKNNNDKNQTGEEYKSNEKE